MVQYDRDSHSGIGRARSVVVFTIALMIVYAGLNPLEVQLPRSGLDPSWIAVLGEASRLDLGFGRDIIFTGGPLSSLYTKYLRSDYPQLQIIFHLCLIVFTAFLFTVLASRGRHLWIAIASAMGLSVMNGLTDVFFKLVPVLAALTLIDDREKAGGFQLDCVSGFFASACGLAKFSTVPLTLVCFIGVDLVSIAKRKLPLATPLFLSTYFCLFALLDSTNNFLGYVAGSLETARGYSEAMYLDTSWMHAVGFLICAAILLVALIINEMKSAKDRLENENRYIEAILVPTVRIGILAALVFLSFKISFTRQLIIGWSGLGVAAILCIIVSPVAKPEYSRSEWLRTLAPSMSVAFAITVFLVPMIWWKHHSQIMQNPIASSKRHIGELLTYLSDPRQWMLERQRWKETAWATVRSEMPLPKLEGTVDAVASIQSSILAHGMNFRPRFTLQEYTTYTPWLIQRNVAALVDRGPENLIFRLESLDRRMPSFTEAALWPQILRFYEPTLRDDRFVYWTRRDSPLPRILREYGTPVERNFREIFEVPGEVPQYARIHLEKSWAGKLINFMYRSPAVTITIFRKNKAPEDYRFIPGIGQEGFLLSPAIIAAEQVAGLALGEVIGLDVTHVKLSLGWLGTLAYGDSFKIAFAKVDLSHLKKAEPSSEAARDFRKNNINYFRLWSQAPESRAPIGLIWSPNSTVELPVDHTSTILKLGYGIIDSAWVLPNATDGVCFRASVAGGGGSGTVFERCLDPMARPEDRGAQSSHIAVKLSQGDRLVLETTCYQTCAWDWSYWSQVVFE